MITPDEGLEAAYPAPPESLPPIPRAVAINRKGRVLRNCALAGLLLAPNAVLAFGWFSGENLRQLDARGETVTGRIVKNPYGTAAGEAGTIKCATRMRRKGKHSMVRQRSPLSSMQRCPTAAHAV